MDISQGLSGVSSVFLMSDKGPVKIKDGTLAHEYEGIL